MKNYIFIAVVALILSSCASIQPVQLVNIYQETPYSFTVEKQFDEVWSKIIDVFSEKGFTINTIDKSSGLIVSSEYSFNGLITYEMMNGMLNDTTSFVVVSKEALTYDMTQKIIPDIVNGNFNIRVKQDIKGTKVSVNITNLKAKLSSYIGTIKQNTEFQAKSTGVFERKLEQLIKE